MLSSDEHNNMINDEFISTFALISEEEFDRLVYARPEISVDNASANCCPNCNIPMLLEIYQYQCSECGIIVDNDSAASHDDDHYNYNNSNIKIATGRNKGKYHNMGTDYSKTQKKTIRAQLLKNHAEYRGKAFPINILNAVADQYNNNQQMIMKYIDAEGNAEQRRFVHRADVKDQILAALIRFECIRENIVRKKRDIAEFMKLTTDGFASGDKIVRRLAAAGYITLPDNEDPVSGYSDRYLDALRIESSIYTDFITDLVQLSEDRAIAMSSNISSKVTGALWIIISQCKLNVTVQQLESVDNTKKATFMKFYRAVMTNIAVFRSLFVTYGIPLPQ